MEKTIRDFVDKLAKTKAPENAVNMFSFDVAQNETRRNNLYLYLSQMAEKKPEVLLVGEAPGYQGMRWTGMPFGSEYHILRGIPEIGMFGEERGYKKTDEWDKVWKEPSSTIVWGTMKSITNVPLIWASYPYHPHQSGKPLTNRAPSNIELEIGRPFLADLIEIYKIKKVLAVGYKAVTTLGKMGIEAPYIRHPSHGGAKLFAEGIRFHLD